jgi:hypothetical protein
MLRRRVDRVDRVSEYVDTPNFAFSTPGAIVTLRATIGDEAPTNVGSGSKSGPTDWVLALI